MPVPGTYPGLQGSKMAILWLNPDQMEQGGSRLDRSTSKGSDVPYHILMDGKVWLGAIFASFSHPSRLPGLQKSLTEVSELWKERIKFRTGQEKLTNRILQFFKII